MGSGDALICLGLATVCELAYRGGTLVLRAKPAFVIDAKGVRAGEPTLTARAATCADALTCLPLGLACDREGRLWSSSVTTPTWTLEESLGGGMDKASAL